MFIDIKDPEILEKSWNFFLKSTYKSQTDNIILKKYSWRLTDLYTKYRNGRIYLDVGPGLFLQYEAWLWNHRVGLVKDEDRLWLRFYKETDISWFFLKCT